MFSDQALTIIIIAITCFVSWQAWTKPELLQKLLFNAVAIHHNKQYYRLVSSAFIHADAPHLIFNMLSLYYMGGVAEQLFKQDYLFGEQWGGVAYVALYFSAAIVSSISDLIRHKNDSWYNALGASGAVSAVIMVFVLVLPWEKIVFFFIPMWSWVFALIYLVGSYIMAKRNVGNIGHYAHFWGAVYGFIFPMLFYPQLLAFFIRTMTTGIIQLF
jgi:membrane associated rhomboid family serine protease